MTCTAYIKKPGYTGAEIEVNAGTSPVIVSYMGEGEDKFSHVKAMECELNFVGTSSLYFVDLFMCKNKEYNVQVFRGNDAVFYGWINPEFFSEPFTYGNYITKIKATDGLAELKNIEYPIPSYSNFKRSVIEVISDCLYQIGSTAGSGSMGISISTELNVTAAGSVHSTRILEQVYLDWRSFRDDDGEMMSCYDVLVEILSMLNARIYQFYGTWRIERIDHKDDVFRVDYYNSAGVFQSSINNTNSIVELTGLATRGSVIRFINDPATLEVQPAAKRFTIHQNYGRRQNILPFTNWAGKFIADEFDAGALRYWTASGSPVITHENRWDSVRIGGFHPTESGLSSKFLDSDSISFDDEGVNFTNFMAAWEIGDLVMKFEFTIGAEYDALTYTTLTMNFSGNDYTLDQDEATDVSGTGTLKSGTGWTIEQGITKGQWKTVTLTVKLPPADEIGETQSEITATVRIYQAIYDGGSGGVMYKDIKLWFEDGIKTNVRDDVWASEQQAKAWERNIETDIDDDNILEPDTYQVTYGNVYPYEGLTGTIAGELGNGLLYKKVVFDSNGDAVNYWGTTGTYINQFLIDVILVNDLQMTYYRPQFLLKGRIIDTTYSASNYGLSMHSIIKDYNDRYYFMTGGSYDLRHGIWTGEWMCMRDENYGEFEPTEFSDEFYI